MSKARAEQERQLLYSNVDANGGVISPEQMAKIQRMKPEQDFEQYQELS
ncbi:MAG TPA: hypothetical protein VK553_04310 [Candidatus Nitrosopolaris rasttigaisensis]|jgi:hypothetical protein|nr:hypothetical protein [Candidatus Nitrosopolaris rasttigaisensis]